MNKYPTYKPSNIDWIGEIPTHWCLTKVKFETSLVVDGTHFTPEYTDFGVPFLRVTDVQSKEIDFDSIKYISEKEHLELTKRCKPQKGDLLLSKNGTIGKTKIVDWDWEFSIFVSLCLIRFKDSFDAKLFSFFFQSDIIDQQLVESSKQSTVTNLHLDKIRELLLILPPLQEQQAIVSYLDEKTALIDELILKKERKIELLKEQRAALINQAVTKGLDAKVAFKDSKIEWIGDIPEHWKCVPFKYIFKKEKDPIKTGPFGSHLKSTDLLEEGIKVYNQRTVYDEDFIKGENYISAEKFKELKGFEVFEGDILITSRGTIGKCTIVPVGIEKGILHPCLIRFRINEVIISKPFVKLYINQSTLFIESIKLDSNATTIEVIYSDTLKNTFIPLPPLSEQQAIVAYLDEQTTLIDKSIALESQKIEKLKEYRQSLISNVVTGKICVA